MEAHVFTTSRDRHRRPVPAVRRRRPDRRSRALLRLGISSALLLSFACGAPRHETESAESVPPEVTARPLDEPGPSEEPESGTGGVSMPDLLEIGVGSGREGLLTVSIDRHGAVTVQRPNVVLLEWERATLQLNEAQREEIAQRIDRDQIYALDGVYSAGVADGTQLVLRMLERDDETVIYCDNECPPEVNAFNELVERLLDEAGLAGAHWSSVGGERSDSALWDAVRRVASRRRHR